MADETVTISRAKIREIFAGWFQSNDEPATKEEIQSEKYLDECTDYFYEKAVEVSA